MRAPTIGKALLLGASASGCMIVGFALGCHFALRSKAPPTDTTPSVVSVQPFADRPADTSTALQAGGAGEPMAGALAHWRALRAQPLTPDTEARMRAELQALAATDPATALKLAQDSPTARQRELFRNSALQGWAARDPRAAGFWALEHVRYEERRLAVEAVAAGAVARPDDALRVFRDLVAADPVLACDHGNALATALAQAGQFETATEFAKTGPAAHRAVWLSTVFRAWSAFQPEAALTALGHIPDPAAREEARGSLYAGWGSSDPAGLVAYAQTLPAGEHRLAALNDGLTQWVYRDPAAASAWMDKFDPSSDLDAGAAAIAVAPVLVEKKPEVAASWAESITDPELRANTLLDLLRLWAEHDAAGARNYATNSPSLRPETRALALSFLQPSS